MKRISTLLVSSSLLLSATNVFSMRRAKTIKPVREESTVTTFQAKSPQPRAEELSSTITSPRDSSRPRSNPEIARLIQDTISFKKEMKSNLTDIIKHDEKQEVQLSTLSHQVEQVFALIDQQTKDIQVLSSQVAQLMLMYKIVVCESHLPQALLHEDSMEEFTAVSKNIVLPVSANPSEFVPFTIRTWQGNLAAAVPSGAIDSNLPPANVYRAEDNPAYVPAPHSTTENDKVEDVKSA